MVPRGPRAAPGEQRAEAITAVLLSTPWLGSLEEVVRPARAQILQQLGLPPPKQAAAPQRKEIKEDGDTYAELVGEMGY